MPTVDTTVDTRNANVAWTTADEGGLYPEIKGGAYLAVLMDIRAELRNLNRMLGCSRFLGIPTTLKEIAENTKKRKRGGVKKP